MEGKINMENRECFAFGYCLHAQTGKCDEFLNVKAHCEGGVKAWMEYIKESSVNDLLDKYDLFEFIDIEEGDEEGIEKCPLCQDIIHTFAFLISYHQDTVSLTCTRCGLKGPGAVGKDIDELKKLAIEQWNDLGKPYKACQAARKLFDTHKLLGICQECVQTKKLLDEVLEEQEK